MNKGLGKVLLLVSVFLLNSRAGQAAGEWDLWFQKYRQAMQAGDYVKAEAASRKALLAAASDESAAFNVPLARSNLIRALYSSGKYSEALNESSLGLQECDRIIQSSNQSIQNVGKTLKRGLLMQRGIILARQKKLAEAEKEFKIGMSLGLDNTTPSASFLEYYAALAKILGQEPLSAQLWAQASKIRQGQGGRTTNFESVLAELYPDEETISVGPSMINELRAKTLQTVSEDPETIAKTGNEIASLNMSKLSGWIPYKSSSMLLKADGTRTNQVMFRNDLAGQDISINSIRPKIGFGPKFGGETVVTISQSTGIVPRFASVDMTGSIPFGKQTLYYYTGTVELPNGKLVKGFVGCTETANQTFSIYGFDFSGQSAYRLEPTKAFLSGIEGLKD